MRTSVINFRLDCSSLIVNLALGRQNITHIIYYTIYQISVFLSKQNTSDVTISYKRSWNNSTWKRTRKIVLHIYNWRIYCWKRKRYKRRFILLFGNSWYGFRRCRYNDYKYDHVGIRSGLCWGIQQGKHSYNIL